MPARKIENHEQFIKTLEYIAKNAKSLGIAVIGHQMSIDTISIFTHSPDEYELVANFVRQQGKVSDVSHGSTLYIEPEDLKVLGYQIKYLGVRQPDETRPEVGYADYPVKNYDDMLIMAETSPFMNVITSGVGQSLIELRHHDFDVRGYICAADEH